MREPLRRHRFPPGVRLPAQARRSPAGQVDKGVRLAIVPIAIQWPGVRRRGWFIRGPSPRLRGSLFPDCHGVEPHDIWPLGQDFRVAVSGQDSLVSVSWNLTP